MFSQHLSFNTLQAHLKKSKDAVSTTSERIQIWNKLKTQKFEELSPLHILLPSWQHSIPKKQKLVHTVIQM